MNTNIIQQLLRSCRLILTSIVLLLCSTTVFGQSGNLRGTVRSTASSAGQTPAPLPGATVLWLGTIDATTTDANGNFEIRPPAGFPARLVVSYVGFLSDTLNVEQSQFLEISLKSSAQLKEVEVTGKQDAISISSLSTIQVEKINQKELLRAACCNLSEAFETNPTVSVAYTDAVTGAREVQLLGLSGIYSQLTIENIPAFRGLAAPYGLTFVPGPWMESIQVTKGAGAIVNGFEGTSGQINIEYIKPDNDDQPRFFLNAFAEPMGYSDLNAFRRFRLNDHWSTLLMVHGDKMFGSQDRNKDGWMDIPMGQQVNLYNRWQYHSRKKLEAQFGFRFMLDDRDGGQVAGEGSGNHHGGDYMTSVQNARTEVFGKLGIVFPEKPLKSIGNIAQVSLHRLRSSFGFRSYNADQTSFFVQSIYQNAINAGQHQYKIGLNLRYDLLEESLSGSPDTLEELVPGGFLEYSWHYFDQLTIVAGYRLDYHNLFGVFSTPRVHLKYDISEDLVLRASAGKSYRVPYRIAENLSLLVSSKRFDFQDELRPEQAWSYGFNLLKRYRLFGKDGSVLLDLFHTDFIDQLVVDRYADSSRVVFFNLKGRSYSNSAQFTVNQEILSQLEIRLALKIDDVRTDYLNGLARKPLVPYQRALGTLHYESTDRRWKADYTMVWTGMKALPVTFTDPVTGIQDKESPSFFTTNIQLTRAFRRLELYAGSENLFDFRQPAPIINRDDPYSDRFDAANVWGPILGRRIYAGFRFKWL